MVIPTLGKYAVSLIRSRKGKVSLHLISIFSEDLSIVTVESKDYHSMDPTKRGTYIEDTDYLFPYETPYVTGNAVEVFDFICKAHEWAKRRIEEEDNKSLI